MIPIAKPLIGDEEKQAVLEVLDSGMLAQGPRVRAFEENFAQMCGVAHAIATSSGTTALHVALLAHGIGPGDEVITSPFTFIATANSILFTGARPVFVDIDPFTFNLDADAVAAAITDKTRAILPVHLFGLLAEMDKVAEVAGVHQLAVIEDACQAHAADYKGQRAGSFGTGTFSLYPTKNITSAEGGMITTNSEEIAAACRVIRQHGMVRTYYHEELGFNFRMTDVHAAIGHAQLGKLERFNAARIANAHYLSQHLKGLVTPTVPDGYRHVFHQYTVRVPDGRRDALAAHLKAHSVGYGIYYPVPIHKQTYYTQKLGYTDSLYHSEHASTEVLSLPVHPGLSPDDLDRIVATVNAFMEAA
jgi:perosamine synthetase